MPFVASCYGHSEHGVQQTQYGMQKFYGKWRYLIESCRNISFLKYFQLNANIFLKCVLLTNIIIHDTG